MHELRGCVSGGAGCHVGHCEHAIHAHTRIHPSRDPVVILHGPLRHVRLEHLHVHHPLLRLLCPCVSPSNLTTPDSGNLVQPLRMEY